METEFSMEEWGKLNAMADVPEDFDLNENQSKAISWAVSHIVTLNNMVHDMNKPDYIMYRHDQILREAVNKIPPLNITK